MELQQIANYLNGKFLINNFKKDKKEILGGSLLAGYSSGHLGSSVCEVCFYDTQDFFFAERGINIYIENTKVDSQLIIRYDSSQLARIEFLKNIPNFFKVKIGKGHSIHNYYEQITEAIYKVFPAGLNVNIEEYLRKSNVVVKINKKRDSYRTVNNTGLKMIINFETCTYINNLTRSKFSQPVLDVFGEDPKHKEEFDLFLKNIIRDHPQLLRLPDNELVLVRSNT